MVFNTRFKFIALTLMVLFALTTATAWAKSTKLAKLSKISMDENHILLVVDSNDIKMKTFEMKAPARLVIDMYGVKSTMRANTVAAPGPFERLRIGRHKEKTRIVLDAKGKTVPTYSIQKDKAGYIIVWSNDYDETKAPKAEVKKVAPEKAVKAVAKKAVKAAPKEAKVVARKAVKAPAVKVRSINFNADDGKSYVRIALDRPGQLIEPEQLDNFVRFGIQNATITRSLKRVIDASSFPSGLRLITPYSVTKQESSDVMFAMEMKDSLDYSVKMEGNVLVIEIDNGAFEFDVSPGQETVKVSYADERDAAPVDQPIADDEIIGAREVKKYTGEKISLVFDSADIRHILQLIAEVSDMNIISSEEVKGTVNLRLIDVPWDQALDIILNINRLGMIKTGNVMEIMPKSKIREMEKADLQNEKDLTSLEPLVTRVFNVDHTDLSNVSGPISELMTERGKVIKDARNKQLIVSDIPSQIDEIEKLIALLDTPERQVIIEARIVEADTSFSQNLGVNWNVNHADKNGGEYIEPSEYSIGGGGAFSLPASLASNGIASALTFGRLGINSTLLEMQLSALETEGKGKIISRPKVATLNGESAKISQGTKIPYQTSGDDGPSTEFVDATLSLTVLPTINSDGTIILDIKATNSSPGSTVSTGSGTAPAINTKEAQTKVLVTDGETTVIGGIFVENKDNAQVGVPILRSIPLLGRFFRSDTKTDSKSELLIFVTPKIVENPVKKQVKK